uniref:Uncharacterized protein n=1 Tax=Zea mays TaxID=4577 RepID=C0PLN5_MAIZE|nr:unknown [Zea mays]
MVFLLFISCKLNFSSTILWQENSVTFLQSNWDQIACLVALTRANSHHFSSIQLLGCFREEDAAGGLLGLHQLLNQHPVQRWEQPLRHRRRPLVTLLLAQ